MKTVLVVLVASVLLAGEAWSAIRARASEDTVLRTCSPVVLYRTMNVGRYEPACVISLRFDIDGIVECALRDAMLLKIAQPDVEVPDILDEIERLTQEGATPIIRYKAWLVRQVYENPYLFSSLVNEDFFTAEEAFASIARRLENIYLATRQ
jgi:hypothetical protein